MARKGAGRKAGKAGTSGAAPRKRAARRAARQGGGDETRSDYRNKVRGQKLEAANKQEGCASKLFVLLLPFVVLGAYIAFRA